MKTKLLHFTKSVITDRRGWQSFLGLLLILALLAPVAFTQDELFTINGQGVEVYLMEKYQVRDDDVRSTLRQTPGGPSGDLYLHTFDRPFITRKRIRVFADDTLQDRSRKLARAFLEEESELLGITHMEEIRERNINTFQRDDGRSITKVRYGRYIHDLELEYMYIQITVGKIDGITAVTAKLVPAPPELYEAVQRPTLTEEEIWKIVEDDFGVTSRELITGEGSMISQVAIPTPPYAVWRVNYVGRKNEYGNWVYRLDAFTGEILKKDRVVIN